MEDGIVAALLAHVEEEVLGVEGLFLVVGVVGGRGFDLCEEVLLDVELADVRDCAALDGVVGEEFGAVVDDGLGVLVGVHKGRREAYCAGGWRGRRSGRGSRS
jgi:hypothetical protein